MLVKRSYRVAGHVFSLSLEEDDKAWGALGNYDPFLCEDDSEELFRLEVVPEMEIGPKKEYYISKPEGGEQRIDIYHIDEGYLFELAPFPETPICGWLKVNSDFSKGTLMSTARVR